MCVCVCVAYRMCSIVVAHSRHEAVTHWPPFEFKEPACQTPKGGGTNLLSLHDRLNLHELSNSNYATVVLFVSFLSFYCNMHTDSILELSSPGRVYSDRESRLLAVTPDLSSPSAGKPPRASCAWVEA